ncbi:hypothetical protein [Amycolatopsis sp. FDAARGOS 1241]|uniref:hypothetical protein n=1 Tax=Amycolatopsis sp. FDAARGOS 1241 TaxID=2778070 RepID=UPI0019525825|nr:hypothetical protein [Amycolatopsis sp. FDAARGOS 1241]QRP49290.1 hypothetical protein I6J71_16875 [Amycolatopsis sp. FDAARGOS 1241]
MPAAAWATLAVSAVIILFAAVGLLRVILHLRHVRRTLGGVLGGVRVIAERTAPVPAALGSVNANLKPVRDFCESV